MEKTLTAANEYLNQKDDSHRLIKEFSQLTPAICRDTMELLTLCTDWDHRKTVNDIEPQAWESFKELHPESGKAGHERPRQVPASLPRGNSLLIVSSPSPSQPSRRWSGPLEPTSGRKRGTTSSGRKPSTPLPSRMRRRYEKIERHQHALAEFLDKPLTPNSLLEMHRRMMAGQSHASPGRYRSTQVIIGGHPLPTPEFVPSLMDELFTFMGKTRNNQVARATWAHVEFESIHPFADGNGRTGRALLLHILGVPIPISRFIHSERSTYYHLFRQYLWPDWLEWMAGGILIECNMRP